ncbi:hypothetical protein U879_18720 [Defluviimonas sp. 20V17]|uniref:Uncharacterized protein n=1 Tax=Allgaiera indica TaxID=765699 RepID=A0AAN4UST3_9RHOB|nr:hypothetical protein U879_18720 [Defluviimonas sp. 20V17]GHE02616.1 hypothetical protein GCM10008024_22870 [Allgaiera indica]
MHECRLAILKDLHATITGHGADLLIRRDLIQEVRQDGAVALAAGREFHGQDVAGARVHRKMDLAVLASAVRAVLASEPLSIPEKLDPCAVDQQVARVGKQDLNRMWQVALSRGFSQAQTATA